MSLPPWIRSIKRPLDQLRGVRRHFDDLPDTEPGDDEHRQLVSDEKKLADPPAPLADDPAED